MRIGLIFHKINKLCKSFRAIRLCQGYCKNYSSKRRSAHATGRHEVPLVKLRRFTYCV